MSAQNRGLGASRMSKRARTVDEDLLNRLQGVGPATSREIPVGLIDPSPFQARAEVRPAEIEELAASIEKDGLLQPILVRPVGSRYELLAGERRWRASEMAGRSTVPAMVRDVDDLAAALIGAIENVQRSNLGAWEEARSVGIVRDQLEEAEESATGKRLAELFSWSEGKISERLSIIDAFPESLLVREGIDLHAVKNVPKMALLLACEQVSDAKRIASLKLAIARAGEGKPVASKRGRPQSSFTLTRRKDGTALFRLRRPPGELDPEEARAAADRLRPLLEELEARAGDQEPAK